jgi:hypothetical protein
MRWQNNGADLPVVGSFESYAVSTLGVLRLLMRLLVGLSALRLLVRLLVGLSVLSRLSVASFLVDMDLLTVLRRLLMRVLCALLGRLLGRLLVLLMLLGRLGTTQALFFVNADLFCDVGVVVLRSVDGSGEGFVSLFVTFPSV